LLKPWFLFFTCTIRRHLFHDDDYAIDPSRLCDIISATKSDTAPILPVDIVENKGALMYIGDEYDTDEED
jgi:hypothetical protein